MSWTHSSCQTLWKMFIVHMMNYTSVYSSGHLYELDGNCTTSCVHEK